jgi:hypothetical protein
MRSIGLLLLSLTLLTSCAVNGPETRPTRDYCLLSKPILVSRQDFLTRGTASQILAHNETFAKLCR